MKYYIAFIAVVFVGGFVWTTNMLLNVQPPGLEAWMVVRVLLPAMGGAAVAQLANMLIWLAAEIKTKRGTC